jgi:hypothetical protein
MKTSVDNNYFKVHGSGNFSLEVCAYMLLKAVMIYVAK